MLRFVIALWLVCIGWMPLNALAFPDRAVRLVVAFPPGGGSDSLSRMLAPRLQELWGQPVIVENRPGVQGFLGTAQGLKAKPDGYTITVVTLGAMAIAPHMYSSIGFDPLKDAVAITRGSQQAMVVSANPNTPVKTLKDIENASRAKPGSLSYGTTGTQPTVMGEYFKLLTNTDMLLVRYAGAGPGVVAVLGGTTDLMMSNPASAIQHIKAGKLRGIAVLDKDRLESLPDMPNAIEAGYPQLADWPEWYGYAVPNGTPPEIVKKLNADFVKVLNEPEVQKAIRALGMTPSPSTPEEFDRQIKNDYERWGKLVRETKVKAE